MVQTVQHALELESHFLRAPEIGARVLEHLAFLYTVAGEVWNDLDAAFRQMMRHEAQLAKQLYEDDVSQYMRQNHCQRLKAVQFLQGTAAERLQTRQQRIMHVLRLLQGEGLSDLPGQSHFSHFGRAAILF